MTTSHALNRFKQKYYYYRCVSTTTTTGKRKKVCNYKYVSFNALETRLTNLLLSLAQEQAFVPLENRILKYNQDIEKEVQLITAGISELKNKLQLASAKKERYLDSLISGQFLSLERQRINEKLSELELEEKQTKATLYKEEFELNQKNDTKIDLIDVKQTLVSFKNDNDNFSNNERREYLTKTIKEIIYHPNKLSIQFKFFPWPVDFETGEG